MANNYSIEKYLDKKSKEEFSWQYNNCMSFVFEYLNMKEVPLEWFLGHKDERSALVAYRRKARELGYKDVSELFDDHFDRELTLHPRDGYIVVRKTEDLLGVACGLTYNKMNVFYTEEGLTIFPFEVSDRYWRVN